MLRRKKNALAGNRTRAARVAGEHSTTEPPVLHTPRQNKQTQKLASQSNTYLKVLLSVSKKN